MSSPDRFGRGSRPWIVGQEQSPEQAEFFPGQCYRGWVDPETAEIGKIRVAQARRILGRRAFDQPPPPVPARAESPPVTPPSPSPQLYERLFDRQAIESLRRRLDTNWPRPLLTLDEQDTLINDPVSYFRGVRRKVNDKPDSTDSLTVRQNRAEASARRDRTRAYAEQAVVSLSLVDSCRSWRRCLSGQAFQPVRLDDAPAKTRDRAAVGLEDLLAAARQNKLLVGGHSRNIVHRLQTDFGSLEPASIKTGGGRLDYQIGLALELTDLVGKNAVLKANLWICQIRPISRGWRLVDPATLTLLREYDQSRRADFRRCFDPLAPLLARPAPTGPEASSSLD